MTPFCDFEDGQMDCYDRAEFRVWDEGSTFLWHACRKHLADLVPRHVPAMVVRCDLTKEEDAE